MEYCPYDLYEVEKIINCKYFNNKKYYLIKWLFYPINQSTWEPKSNLKHLKYLIDEFEAQYPQTIDQNMYNIFCNEIKNKMKIKNRNKKINNINPNIHLKYLSKKRRMDLFSDDELNDPYLDSLKVHLHIKVDTNKSKTKNKNKDLIIDLSLNNEDSEKNTNNSFEKEDYGNKIIEEKKENVEGLLIPNML